MEGEKAGSFTRDRRMEGKVEIGEIFGSEKGRKEGVFFGEGTT